MIASHEPILHIGYPKCASTFLQEVIFPKLSSREFIICSETQRILATTYYHDLPDDLLFFRLGRSRYIYSSEGFLQCCYHWSSGCVEAYEREISISNITRVFRDFGTILIVIRRQDELVESLCKASAGRFKNPDNVFIDFPIRRYNNWQQCYKLVTRRGFMFTDSFDYYKWVMRIVSELGKERVHVLVYEDLVWNSSRFFENLGSVVGENIEHLRKSSDERRQVSPSTSVVIPQRLDALAARVKKYMPRQSVYVKAVLSKRHVVRKKYKQELLRLFTDSNRALSREFSLGLDRYGYY